MYPNTSSSRTTSSLSRYNVEGELGRRPKERFSLGTKNVGKNGWISTKMSEIWDKMGLLKG